MWSNEEKEKFRLIMRKLGLIYSKKVTDELIEIYEFCFQKFDFEQVTRALGQCVRTCKFFPTPAEVIEALGFGERAEAAWYVLVKALNSHGAYKSVRFEDRLIHYVVNQLGGWVYLASLSTTDLKFIKHDFISLYQQSYRTGVSLNDLPEHLPGLAELSNTKEMIEEYREYFEVVNIPCPYSSLSASESIALPLPEGPGVVDPPSLKGKNSSVLKGT